MYVLGIGCHYHDSSATLVKDGRIVAAAEEERFTRRKHDTSFPENAIEYCLRSEGITMRAVEQVAFYEKPMIKFERVLHQHLEMFPFSLKSFVKHMPSWLTSKLRVRKKIRKLGYPGKVIFLDHHLSHAASSFLPSPFEKAAFLTVDGVGEWTTTAYGTGEGPDIRVMKEMKFPHSIGLLYSTITAYLGFSVNNSEYKVMGLSAYGDMNRNSNEFYDKLKEVIDLNEDGSFRLDMRYFRYHYSEGMPSSKLCELFGAPVRKKESEMTQKEMDIAAALQMITEDILVKILNHVHKETGYDDLVMSGGVALNSVFNGKILKSSPFKRVWIQPSPGDGGSSMGAALYAYHNILKNPKRIKLENAYLGPGFSDKEIEKFLEENNIAYSRFKDDADIVATTSKLIFDNKVVGWFQGRMEWGPRALGSRSILANPCNPQAQALLNEKVKHRERFRPFAPGVCEDDAMDFFECDEPVPEPTDYMLMVYPIRDKWRDKIPSVTHVDGSGRLQTIRKSQNARYYDVIKEFGKLSGIPILINTSFNIRGEPIVCTPQDAYKCMMGTGIDCLVMGDFLIRRKDNPKDIWDSEEMAID